MSNSYLELTDIESANDFFISQSFYWPASTVYTNILICNKLQKRTYKAMGLDNIHDVCMLKELAYNLVSQLLIFFTSNPLVSSLTFGNAQLFPAYPKNSP